MAVALAVASVLGTVAVSLAVGSPAYAGTIQSDQAQAGQLAAQIADQMGQIDRLSQQYDQAQTQYQTTVAALAQVRAQLATAQSQADSARQQLRKAALAAYMGDTGSTVVTDLFQGNGDGMVARSEYQHLSDGQLTGAIDRYQRAEHQVSTEQTQLNGDQATEQATLASLARTQRQAQAAVAQENAQLASVKTNLQQQLLAQAHALEVQKVIQQEKAAVAAAAQRQQQQQLQ